MPLSYAWFSKVLCSFKNLQAIKMGAYVGFSGFVLSHVTNLVCQVELSPLSSDQIPALLACLKIQFTSMTEAGNQESEA